jgi:hypothetical protein
VAKHVEQVRSNEPIARFLFSKNHFSRVNERVKPVAFIPHPDIETSVFRIEDFSESQLREIAKSVGGEHEPARTPLAHAEVEVRVVRNAGLDVIPDEPPPRHAEIVDWPRGDKSQQLEIAKIIAAVARLILHE